MPKLRPVTTSNPKPVPRIEDAANESRDRLARMMSVATEFKSWKKAATTLVEAEAVPTIFPHVDFRLGVKGFPISRIALVHGPSHEGKSLFALGLMRSFLERGHFAGLIDAERAITEQFARFAMRSAFDLPTFTTLPTNSYDKVRAGVREWCDQIAEARATKRIPEDTTGLLVVDSIRKLIPDKMWEALSKEIEDAKPKRDKFGKVKKSDGDIDGMSGRGGQIKAKFNAAWMDELVPIIHDTKTTILIIGRERIVKNTSGFGGDIIELGGGDSLKYDPSIRFRVVQDERWFGTGQDRVLAGGRHVVEIHKTRYAARERVVPTAIFHSSNGTVFRPGFDRAADVIELGIETTDVTLSGSWYEAHVGQGEMVKLGQGLRGATQFLHENPEILQRVEAVCRERF